MKKDRYHNMNQNKTLDMLPACIMFAYVEGESYRIAQGKKKKRRKHT